MKLNSYHQMTHILTLQTVCVVFMIVLKFIIQPEHTCGSSYHLVDLSIVVQLPLVLPFAIIFKITIWYYLQ